MVRSNKKSNDFLYNIHFVLDKVSVFGTQEKQRGIGIQVTNRSTHQVMSRIFLMFLTEVLDYNDVQIIPIHYQNETDPDNALQTLEYIM